MRLDHIAYRVKNRLETAKFFMKTFGYKLQQDFTIDFGEGQFAECVSLEPPEKILTDVPWSGLVNGGEYHLPPEIFVSDGTPGSIVGDWVAARNNIGGIHHIAYQVDSVEKVMKEWQEKGYAEFTSEKPVVCKDDKLVQVFTKPSVLTGVIYEFIERQGFGFCVKSVKQLMESTKSLN